MKKLRRIILVNWYLFEAAEWQVDGHVALVGKNGSGKSSFIDALQYVNLGGNKSDWQPNAKATDRRRARDVRSYILGLIKDEEAIEGATSYQPRPDALCRIVLVYTDELTGEEVSIGAALSARRSDPQEHVEGFFIAEHCSLTLADLLETTPVGDVPKTYGALRQYIAHKTATVYFFGHEPKAFVTQMLLSLGPARRTPVTEKYRRSFKQSINMSGLEGSVSDFVRSSILDDKPINLEQMRQSVASWRNKQVAVARIKDQISRLEQILDHLRRAKNSGQRRAGHVSCAAEFQFMAADFRREEVTSIMDGCIGSYRQTRKEKRVIDRELKRLDAELRDVRRALDQDQAEATRQRLSERLETAQRDAARLNEQLVDARQRLGHVSDLAAFGEQLPPDAVRQLDTLAKLSHDICGAWPEDANAVDTSVSGMKSQLPAVIEGIESRRDDAAIRANELKKGEEETQRNLERLQAGKSMLHPNTQTLIDALNEQGIDAVPVCDVVEVIDPEWQPAIEAYLGGNTQALIVDPKAAERAVEIYRRVKRNVFGSTVVNTRKVEQWKDSAEPGTAPSLIRGTDPLAVTYVRHLLRNIRLRDVATTDLMNEQRALSKDGMFVAEAAIQRKQPRPLILGLGARERQIAELERRYSEQQRERIASEQTHKHLRALHAIASKLDHVLADYPKITLLVSQLIDADRSIRTLTTRLEAVDTSHLATLRIQEADLAGLASRYKVRLDRCMQEIGEVRGAYRTNRKLRDEISDRLPYLNEQRQKCREDEDYDSQRANELLAELEAEQETESVAGYESLAHKAEERAKADASRQKTQETEARDMLSEYRANYPTEGFIMEPITRAGERAQLGLMLNDLRNVGLHDREKDVLDALFEVQRVIRSDLSLRLRSNIHDMRRRFEELNAELKRRPFSANQIYQFHYAQRKEYAGFLSFVEHVDEHLAADTGGLFDEYAHINSQIEEMLSGEGGDRLADYREYYTFDIEIRDTDAGISEMLSRRLGAASGGEHKTPFYVAMGASLASAYRLENQPDGTIDGGISLYLADEAFEKMDAFNTVQAANYLKSIGLQLFIAAPDDAEPRLRQIVDTVLFFIREGDKAWVDADYVTDAARSLLASAYNPRALANA